MKVVSFKSLPMRIPIFPTAVAALVLDRLAAPDIAWGIVGTVFALFWIVWIIAVVNQEQIDLFPADGKIKVTRDPARESAVD